MISTVELGEVYVCVFPFTSGQGAKARRPPRPLGFDIPIWNLKAPASLAVSWNIKFLSKIATLEVITTFITTLTWVPYLTPHQ